MSATFLSANVEPLHSFSLQLYFSIWSCDKSCANGLLMRFVHLIKGDTGELAKTLPNSLRTTLWKCACLSHSVIDGRIWSLVHHGAGLLYEIRWWLDAEGTECYRGVWEKAPLTSPAAHSGRRKLTNLRLWLLDGMTFFYICCPTAIRIIKKRNMEEINCINRSHYRIMTCTDLDTSKVFKTSKCRRPRSIDSFCHFSMNPTYTCKTTYVQPFSVPVQVLSLGWTVQKSPIRAGWAAHSQEQPVDTYWETQAFNGKQQETATKDCLSSASLVCVLNHTL